MTWDDKGYDMWEEVKEFYKKAWAQRIEPFALAEFMDAMTGFNANDVVQGLRYIYRNQDRALRPSIKQVMHAVMTVREEQKRKSGVIEKDEYCKWCDNTKYFYVGMYIVTAEDLPEGFVWSPERHTNMKRMYKYRDEFLVKPEAAKKKGVFRDERSLWCDRCMEENFEAGRPNVAAIRPFVTYCSDFFDCFDATRSQLERICDDDPPRIRRSTPRFNANGNNKSGESAEVLENLQK